MFKQNSIATFIAIWSAWYLSETYEVSLLVLPELVDP